MMRATVLFTMVSSIFHIVSGGVKAAGFNDISPSFFESQKEVPLITAFRRSDGSYRYGYRLTDQRKEETRSADGEVVGSFAFVDPEGEEHDIRYTAGKQGFVPEGADLPQAPEYTPDVQKARREFLQYYRKLKANFGEDEEEETSQSNSESESLEEEEDEEEEEEEEIDEYETYDNEDESSEEADAVANSAIENGGEEDTKDIDEKNKDEEEEEDGRLREGEDEKVRTQNPFLFGLGKRVVRHSDIKEDIEQRILPVVISLMKTRFRKI